MGAFEGQQFQGALGHFSWLNNGWKQPTVPQNMASLLRQMLKRAVAVGAGDTGEETRGYTENTQKERYEDTKKELMRRNVKRCILRNKMEEV